MTNRTKKRIGKMGITISILVLGFLFISPLLWMIIASVKPETLIFKDMGFEAFIPKETTFDNYAKILFNENINFFHYMGNSLFTVGMIVILGTVVNSICAYALVKLKFPGSDLILIIIIALYVVPFESVLIPLYIVVNKFGWINEFPALIIPFIASAFNIFLFRQFFMGFPKELEEAAQIDGASPWQTFVRIVVPNSKPVFATAAILTFVTHWSDFMWPLIVATDQSIQTVQIGIQYLFTDNNIQYGQIMAALTLTTIPVILIFIFFQRYYVQGITSSGVKG
ncbi:carbohydrate ABC transporter permease [Bacillus sp. ISL-40]|nr:MULTISPECIES: carbohydrate ABC transporter permease [unclassified Bacillus (in: firmicutes)]MBT2695979.1 carbohydrate ABC transporter permease [Bacillus sp. ISL-40]MBT2719513.1 carbohydrate ABC transporter permease [Bacillus sp. ISL-46]MBT2726768.1 carbohydrate ABC transporter permease [Bacillus sp. ISL-75]MBT2739665.1 carbohydrate ABC transporter permease [Bacillus sp. ISL-77]